MARRRAQIDHRRANPIVGGDMLSAEEYRKFAEECVRLAQAARSHQRAALLRMAETWLTLADEAERLRHAFKAPDC